MTTRRQFLTRSGLALGALIVGDEVAQMVERLSHRKVFALGMTTPSVSFSVSKQQDRSFYDYEAIVKEWDASRTYRLGIAYMDHPTTKQKAMYGIGKLMGEVERNHTIPFPVVHDAATTYINTYLRTPA